MLMSKIQAMANGIHYWSMILVVRACLDDVRYLKEMGIHPWLMASLVAKCSGGSG